MQNYDIENKNGKCENSEKIGAIYWKQYHSDAEV